MAEQFYSILTSLGKAELANSAALGNKVNFSKLQLGDGKGSYYNPSEDQTTLVNKLWEGNIGSVKIDDENANWVIIETVVPASDGGFYIREAGIIDDSGNLVAVSKMAETYKPLASEGSSKDLIVRVILEVSNASSVNLKIDPTVILATKKDVQTLQNDLTEKIQKLATKVDNIDLSASKVSLSAIGGMSSKNVQAGMQELFQFASNGKSAIAGVVGNVTGSNTFNEIKNRIQADKNTLAANITSKGVTASEGESVGSLAAKVKNITITTMGGKKYATGPLNAFIEGTANAAVDCHYVQADFSNLGFTPSIIEVNIENLLIYWSDETSPTGDFHGKSSFVDLKSSKGYYPGYSIESSVGYFIETIASTVNITNVPIFKYVHKGNGYSVKNSIISFKAWE